MSAVVLVDPNAETAETFRNALGPDTVVVVSIDGARRFVAEHPLTDAVVVSPTVDLDEALRFAEATRIEHPTLGVVLVRRRVDAAVLADALRTGMREVVLERDLSALVDAVRRVHDVARAMRESVGGTSEESDQVHARVVTVFSAKGGCGKTTLATNLAAALADGGRREVCLVDLDLAFGDVAIAMQLFPAHTIADAVPLADSIDRPGVSGLLTPHSPGLTTLVAPVEPGSADIPAPLISDLLYVLRQMFDYVIIDTPPAFTDHVLAAFDQSDVIALIATLDIPALKNLKLTLETLDLLNYPRDRWRVVLNRADSKVGLSLSEVEKTLRAPIAAEIPSSRAVPAAINRGVPIMLDERNHPVSVAIRTFADKHVISTHKSDAVIPSELRSDRRSFLRRRARTS